MSNKNDSLATVIRRLGLSHVNWLLEDWGNRRKQQINGCVGSHDLGRLHDYNVLKTSGKRMVENVIKGKLSNQRSGSSGKGSGKAKNPSNTIQTIAYEARKTQTGSEDYYPILNGKSYYTLKYRTKRGALNEAERMAKAYQAEMSKLGYKVKISQKKPSPPSQPKRNYWPDNSMGHSKAAKKGWETRAYMGTKKTGSRMKKNPKLPNTKDMTKIYDNILAIEARKGKDSHWPEESFRHDFSKDKTSVYGLKDGSLLIKGNKPLWKNFNYRS